MATVTATIARMMRAYPSLYPSRQKALFNIFSSSTTVWVNGELVHAYPDEYNKVWSPKNEDDDRTNLISIKLRQARDLVLYQFTVDNAVLLAANDVDLDDDYYIGWMQCDHFADMPEEVNADWYEAAKELAFGIKSNFETRVQKTDSHYAHKQSTYRNAMKFLMLHNMLDDKAVKARIKALRDELAALELSLINTELDG